jgi:flavin reductase (DIM6/NTAB) family NADH-FMN oxidoreductase RutF
MKSSHTDPPMLLRESLEINPDEWTHEHLYNLVTSLVVPRPVAWVSTVSLEGYRNLAPHSYFNLVSDWPPHVAFSSIGVKDTLRNINATKEFVLNFASQRLLNKLDATGDSLPPEVDEFQHAGLTAVPAARVRAPRVAEARAHMECRLHRVIPVGNGNIVLGRVVHIHVDPSIWLDGQVDVGLLDPIVRLSKKYGVLGPEYSPEEEPSSHVLQNATFFGNLPV